MPLCPTEIALSGLPPTAVNPAPEMLADEILTVPVPVFVNVSVWVALLPTARLPKVRVEALGVKMPAPGEPGVPPPGVLALVKPAQLERPATARSTATVARRATVLP